MVALSSELWFNPAMLKARAIELLGGTVASAAKAVRVSYQAVDKWPDVLPPRISDRVLAAVARKHLPASLVGDDVDLRSPERAAGQVARTLRAISRPADRPGSRDNAERPRAQGER